MKLQLKNHLENRVDFYHTFCPGNHRDGNEYLSTQSISNMKCCIHLRRTLWMCFDSSLFWQLFVLVLVLLLVCCAMLLCCVVAEMCSSALLPVLDLSCTAACSWLVMHCCLLLTCHALLPALDLFFVSGGYHMLSSYFLVLYGVANTQKHFSSPPWVSKWCKTFWHHDESAGTIGIVVELV